MTFTDLLNPTASIVEPLRDFARAMPGGPALLVLALFCVPLGFGIPAGILFARHVPIHPILTWGLYGVSDTVAAALFHPLYRFLHRYRTRLPPLRWLGRRIFSLAMRGTGVPRPDEVGRAGMRPALTRIAATGFAVDVYTGGFLASMLPGRHVLGWACAVGGDLVWFASVLAAGVAAGTVTDDDRYVGLAVVAAMLAVPALARRLFPSLRAALPPSTAGPRRGSENGR